MLLLKVKFINQLFLKCKLAYVSFGVKKCFLKIPGSAAIIVFVDFLRTLLFRK